jgi:hypothetical protein
MFWLEFPNVLSKSGAGEVSPWARKENIRSPMVKLEGYPALAQDALEKEG